MLFEIGAIPYAVLTAHATWRAHGARLAELAGVAPGERLLDLGCGPGESAFGMAERVAGLRVVGVDYSELMIRIARARRRFDRAAANVQLVRADATKLPFPDGSFDAVTGHSFLYLVPDPARVLAEVRRLLRPERKCVFLEPAVVPDRPLLPRALRRKALRAPRFVSSMALWRLVSRRYGRFDETRFSDLFARAGLELERLVPTLEGLGLMGVGRRPTLRRLRDVDWDAWTPTDRATLLFVVDEGARRVLLIRKKRGLGAGKVNAPGGRLEPGESAAAAAVRECEEELGVTPTGVRMRGELRFQFADGYALQAYVFDATGCRGVPTETSEAIPLWTPLDRIPYDQMWADDALWLPLMLAGRTFSGRFIFDGDRMVDHDLAVDVPVPLAAAARS